MAADDLDSLVQGNIEDEYWNDTWDSLSKYKYCLGYKARLIYNYARTINSPIPLIEYYSTWINSLSECDDTYKIDSKESGSLRERAGTLMAVAIGEVTESFLHTQRIFNDSTKKERDTMWHSDSMDVFFEVELKIKE